MANIEKRGDSYRIKVCVGYDSKGKKITQSTTYHPEYTTRTGKVKAESVIQKELERYAAEFERKVKNGDLLAESNMKFSELVERYLKEYAYMELTTATAEGYETYLRNKLLPHFGHFKVADLCRQTMNIQTFYNDTAKKAGDERALASSTINRHITIFSSVMRWAVDMHIAPNNPLTRVKPPRTQYKKPTPKSFTLEELNRFIQALELPQTATYKAHKRTLKGGTTYSVPEYTETRFLSEQFKLFYIMAAFSGCRRSELIALDWSDFNFDKGTINISKTVSKTSKGIIVKETKTSSGTRVINMPVSVMDLAKRWRTHQQEERLKLGTFWKGIDNVFCQADGTRMYPDTVSAKFKDVILNYNSQCQPNDKLPEITLHGLRHTSASILIYQNTDIATVSKRLGHSKTSVTLDIYTHAIAEADKTAANTLDIIAKNAGIS
ncbi:site-specific integrase [Ruminococcus sp. OA3]|uniref:tyrosine-type recombinase/integrase n=1 Tax=Ruminococcus sp. OA3 TaxID=2914164 RepID=UPI001F063627|nr:site-specific integrase [Ruminococcus sp. OA3]MCH1982453.1 site-specific integrase [Ruminococcus sp. OA3]